MAQFPVRRLTKLWSPSNPAGDATDILFSMKAGDRVLWASAMPITSGSVGAVGTVALGDGTSTAGYIAAITPTLAAAPPGTLINGQGALLNQSGGKLYTVDDNIDALWDWTSNGPLVPAVRFTIAVVREYPA